MSAPSFTRNALRIGAGLLIWAAHFSAIYLYNALACARGWGDPRIGIGIFTLIAVLALAAVFRTSVTGRWYVETKGAELPYVAWFGATSAGFGLLGVLWCAMPALWVAAC